MSDYTDAFRAAEAARRAVASTYPNWFAITAEANFSTLLPRDTHHALQIGAFTGDATVWLLDHCPHLHLTDLDTWLGSPGEPIHAAFDWDDVHATYLRRTAPYGDRLTVHRITSDAFFANYDGPPFDLVYVDGSHETLQVARDAEHAHAHLAPGGILVFDDYLWGSPDYVNAPRPAIDAFVREHTDDYQLLAANSQVWLRRFLSGHARATKDQKP